jgi:1,4-dihydroxy-2-naphthoate octaprenyltransferase
VGDLWALTVASILAAAFNARIALQLWNGKMDFRKRPDDEAASEIPESRLRVNSVMVANAWAVSSFALFALCTASASTIGHTTLGRVFLVLASCAGAAFIVFIGIAISIFFTNKPSRFVPPVLRDRKVQG